MRGFKLTGALIENSIAYYRRMGRTVDAGGARIIGRRMMAEDSMYESATAAVDDFLCMLWNGGYVR